MDLSSCIHLATTWMIRKRRVQSMFVAETEGNTEERAHTIKAGESQCGASYHLFNIVLVKIVMIGLHQCVASRRETNMSTSVQVVKIKPVSLNRAKRELRLLSSEFSSLAQHKTRALANYATEAGCMDVVKTKGVSRIGKCGEISCLPRKGTACLGMYSSPMASLVLASDSQHLVRGCTSKETNMNTVQVLADKLGVRVRYPIEHFLTRLTSKTSRADLSSALLTLYRKAGLQSQTVSICLSMLSVRETGYQSGKLFLFPFTVTLKHDETDVLFRVPNR
uniref:(California timema) hypothetical protein n=1 Tax=Timema californicum TaxID=61474 RepID=A0A7R9J458_TIMCA|nr:unnamed protein product [Timema californicum]